jgi:hypothetical protein
MIGNIGNKRAQGENTTTLDLSHLLSGVYFYTLTIDIKIVFKDKILKNRTDCFILFYP